MCSTRSASVSRPPNIIVAVVEMSSRCASRITPSHSVARRLLGADVAAHAVDEDLGAAARQRVEPGVAQPRERLVGRDAGERAMCTISGGPKPCTWMAGWSALMSREHALVPLDGEVGVHAALQQDRGAVERDRLGDLLGELLAGQHVGVGRVGRAVEGAEAAAGDADVGVVDVAVDDEGDLALGHEPLAHGAGGLAEREEVGRARAAAERFVGGEAVLAGGGGEGEAAAAGSRHDHASSPKMRSSGTRRAGRWRGPRSR